MSRGESFAMELLKLGVLVVVDKQISVKATKADHVGGAPVISSLPRDPIAVLEVIPQMLFRPYDIWL